MPFQRSIFLFLSLLYLSLGTFTSFAQTDEQQLMVSMRMIGHQLLLDAGDDTSRILPIENKDDQYTIRFESDFEFLPDRLVSIVDSVMEATTSRDEYLVEVKNCDEKEVIYSYRVETTSTDVIPCRKRTQPENCYVIVLTVPSVSNNSNAFLLVLIVFILFVVVFFLYRIFPRKSISENIAPELIMIGQYRFNPRNMKLSFKKSSVELTSKEADLLLLLHTSLNQTIEREILLKEVWGDEGDYVGRTLDVFISKLRKKLSEDAQVKIMNVRGVGYKMMVG